MFGKFVTAVMIILLWSLAYGNIAARPAAAADNYNVSVKNYSEYYRAIAKSVLSSRGRVSLKLENYHPAVYDFNRVMQQMENEYPEIMYYYQGAQLQIRGYYDYQKYRIQDIHFQYKSSSAVLNQIKTVNNYSEFTNALASALNSFDSNLVLKINNYDPATYNLGNTIERLLASNPDLDYGYLGSATQISTTGNRRIMQITFQYAFSQNQMDYMRRLVNEKCYRIVKSLIKPGMSDYEKEVALHNYLVNNARYSDRDLINGKGPKEEYTPYGVLIKKVGGCSSYAKAFQKLMKMAGVKCIYVSGQAQGVPHAWNIVKIRGRYYHVDVTWDDPVTSNGRSLLRYDYFNLPDSKMMKDHQWDRGKYPKCG